MIRMSGYSDAPRKIGWQTHVSINKGDNRKLYQEVIPIANVYSEIYMIEMIALLRGYMIPTPRGGRSLVCTADQI